MYEYSPTHIHKTQSSMEINYEQMDIIMTVFLVSGSNTLAKTESS